MNREHGTKTPESQVSPASHGRSGSRKPYSSPRLRVLGHVNAITLGTPNAPSEQTRRKPQG